MPIFIALLLIQAASAALIHAEEVSKEAIQKILKENPEIILEALQENKAELFNLVNQGAQEARLQQQEQELEGAFKNPLSPKITRETRIRGNKKARYTLVEYSDFQCPYCSRGFQTVEALREKYGKDLRFIYKHLPLDFHKQAMPAAQYFEAIALQSQEKAWKFHDALFQNQDKIGEVFFKETAQKLGADMNRLEKDLQSEGIKKRIQEDIQEANAFGFTGTPGFLLNGVPIKGAYPIEYFETILRKLQDKKKG